MFLERLVTYSLNAVKTYHAIPVVLVFGINKISPISLILEFHAVSEQKPWLLTIPSLIWAKKCFIISKGTIPDNNYHSCPTNLYLAYHSSCWSNNCLCIATLILMTRLSSYFIKSRSRNDTLKKHTNKIFSQLWKQYAQRTNAYFKVFLKRLSQRNRSTTLPKSFQKSTG